MPVYLNTFEVWQEYGGPEEGGWWYEAGRPVQSVLISQEELEEWLDSQDPQELAKMRQHATLAYTEGRSPTPRDTGFGGYTFAPGSDEPLAYYKDDDFRSWFEDCYAQPFPQERPYYC